MGYVFGYNICLFLSLLNTIYKEFLDKKNVYIYLKRIFLLCLILLPIMV